jgi:hypothetical protein
LEINESIPNDALPDEDGRALLTRTEQRYGEIEEGKGYDEITGGQN